PEFQGCKKPGFEQPIAMTLRPVSRQAERDSAPGTHGPVSRRDFLAGLKRSVQLTADLGATIRMLADELMKRLSADRILIAARQANGARALLWSVGCTEVDGPPLLDRS